MGMNDVDDYDRIKHSSENKKQQQHHNENNDDDDDNDGSSSTRSIEFERAFSTGIKPIVEDDDDYAHDDDFREDGKLTAALRRSSGCGSNNSMKKDEDEKNNGGGGGSSSKDDELCVEESCSSDDDEAKALTKQRWDVIISYVDNNNDKNNMTNDNDNDNYDSDDEMTEEELNIVSLADDRGVRHLIAEHGDITLARPLSFNPYNPQKFRTILHLMLQSFLLHSKNTNTNNITTNKTKESLCRISCQLIYIHLMATENARATHDLISNGAQFVLKQMTSSGHDAAATIDTIIDHFRHIASEKSSDSSHTYISALLFATSIVFHSPEIFTRTTLSWHKDAVTLFSKHLFSLISTPTDSSADHAAAGIKARRRVRRQSISTKSNTTLSNLEWELTLPLLRSLNQGDVDIVVMRMIEMKLLMYPDESFKTLTKLVLMLGECNKGWLLERHLCDEDGSANFVGAGMRHVKKKKRLAMELFLAFFIVCPQKGTQAILKRWGSDVKSGSSQAKSKDAPDKTSLFRFIGNVGKHVSKMDEEVMREMGRVRESIEEFLRVLEAAKVKEEHLVEAGGDAGDRYALKAVGGAYKGWCDVRDNLIYEEEPEEDVVDNMAAVGLATQQAILKGDEGMTLATMSMTEEGSTLAASEVGEESVATLETDQEEEDMEHETKNDNNKSGDGATPDTNDQDDKADKSGDGATPDTNDGTNDQDDKAYKSSDGATPGTNVGTNDQDDKANKDDTTAKTDNVPKKDQETSSITENTPPANDDAPTTTALEKFPTEDHSHLLQLVSLVDDDDSSDDDDEDKNDDAAEKETKKDDDDNINNDKDDKQKQNDNIAAEESSLTDSSLDSLDHFVAYSTVDNKDNKNSLRDISDVTLSDRFIKPENVNEAFPMENDDNDKPFAAAPVAARDVSHHQQQHQQDEMKKQRKKCQKLTMLIILILVIIGGIVVGVIFGTGKTNSPTNPSAVMEDVTIPSNSPSLSHKPSLSHVPSISHSPSVSKMPTKNKSPISNSPIQEGMPVVSTMAPSISPSITNFIPTGAPSIAPSLSPIPTQSFQPSITPIPKKIMSFFLRGSVNQVVQQHRWRGCDKGDDVATTNQDQTTITAISLHGSDDQVLQRHRWKGYDKGDRL